MANTLGKELNRSQHHYIHFVRGVFIFTGIFPIKYEAGFRSVFTAGYLTVYYMGSVAYHCSF